MTNNQNNPFEYWVNVYETHIDMGGSTREEADANAEVMADGFHRIACRLLRYTPGQGVRDVTPKRKVARQWSPESRAAASKRMKRLRAEGRMGRKKLEAGRP